MAKIYLNNLTALRGIAAILVALLHYDFFIGSIVLNNSYSFVDKLYLMVDLFFILSGFIMCYVYEDQFQVKVVKTNYKNFLIARLARIYPLHFITLCVEIFIFLCIVLVGKYDALSSLAKYAYSLETIPMNLLFVHTVGFHNFVSWNSPSWSLSAEWWAYVIFPFLFLLFRKIGYKYWFAISIFAISGWFIIELILAPLEPFFTFPRNPKHITLDVIWHFGTIRGIVGFIAGMSIWQLYKQSTFKNIMGNGWTLLFFSIAGLISMQVKLFDSIAVTFFALLILSSAYGSKSIDRFYSWKVFEKLGKWSFSIYMWHMVLLNIIMKFFDLYIGASFKNYLNPSYVENLLYLMIYLILVCFIGSLSYKFIENPTRKWVRKKFSS